MQLPRADRPLLRRRRNRHARDAVEQTRSLAGGRPDAGVEGVAHDRKQPGLHVGPRLEPVDRGNRLGQCLLHQIVGIGAIAAERSGESAQRGNEADDIPIGSVMGRLTYPRGPRHVDRAFPRIEEQSLFRYDAKTERHYQGMVPAHSGARVRLCQGCAGACLGIGPAPDSAPRFSSGSFEACMNVNKAEGNTFPVGWFGQAAGSWRWQMWLELTDTDGRPVVVNMDHVISFRTEGDRTSLNL